MCIFWHFSPVLVLVSLSDGFNQLKYMQELEPSKVLEQSKVSCVFGVSHLSLVSTIETFETLEKLFHNSEIQFGALNIESFEWPNGESLYIKKTILSDEYILFQKIPTERNCLLPSKVLALPAISVISASRSVTDIVAEINDKCFLFVSPSGGVNLPGLHRNDILQNLFSVSHLPTSLTISEIRETYGDLVFLPELRCRTDKSSHFLASKPGFTDNCFVSESQRSADSVTSPPIPACPRITPHVTQNDFLLNYLEMNRPVIISKGAAHWKAFHKWTNEFLREQYGQNQVHVKLTPGGDFEGIEEAMNWEDFETFHIPEAVRSKLPYPDLVVVRPATLNMPFSEFLDFIEWAAVQPHRNVSAYLEYASIPDHLPELEQDLVEPPYLKHMLNLRQLNIWLSDGNTLGRLHYDPYDNFLCQLRGKKQVIMFEPLDNTRLYEAHIPEATLSYNKTDKSFRRKTLEDSTSMVMSPVDLLSPDLVRFPKFADARPLNCTLEEGDVLFMPAFWWHEVYSWPNTTERRNLAVNYWYEPFLAKEYPCPECPLDVNPTYRHML